MTVIEGIVANLESQTTQVKENQVALQRKLELAESENSRLREVAAGLQDGNRELRKNLANETQKNLILEDQVKSLESVLHQKEDRLVSTTESLNAERAKTEIVLAELQVMKNWVSQLGGQNAKINEKLEGKEAEVTSIKKELENEKMTTHILEAEVHVMKKWVAELGGQNAKYLEEADQKDSEMEKLRKECQELKEYSRIQEENMITEQRRLRERQTRLEEALRDQDKYLLMTLLHGTAQRNFHLEQIALQHGNEILDISEKERQEEHLRMRMEKQHRIYCDTQRERTNYGNQWEVLTQTLTDIVHGDERTPEATTADSNNCEIPTENLADKTSHQSNEDKML
ncbi:uncharacterized protein [Macrobrachium rosenbergii]|uniref:uncharacterized protein n=1 Tax=Macrobrachium rosenbergii TaxID=79674 RepID=UPI0034D59115